MIDEFGISRGWRTVLCASYSPVRNQDYEYHSKQPWIWKVARNTAKHHHNALEFLQWQTWEGIQTPNGALSFFFWGLLLHWKAHQNKRSDSPPSASWSSWTCGWMQEEKNSSQGRAHKNSLVNCPVLSRACSSSKSSSSPSTRFRRLSWPDLCSFQKLLLDAALIWHGNAWKAASGKGTHTHRSFERITRALFVFTLNAAAANLYSLYSICRLKPAQKSSDPRPWIWHGTQFCNSIRTASDGPSKWKRLCKMKCWDCKRWNRVKRTSPVLTRAQRLSWELVVTHNIMSFGCHFSIIMLGCYAPHQVGIKLGHTGPPRKAFRRRSGLGPRCKKVHRSRVTPWRNVWIFRPVYLPKKCLYIVSFHCNSYLLLTYYFDPVPQGYAKQRRATHTWLEKLTKAICIQRFVQENK